MDCQEVQNLYEKYLSGQLEPNLIARVQDHISDCADCFMLDRGNRGFLSPDLTGQPQAKSNQA